MTDKKTLTTTAGAPIADNQNSMTAGPLGPLNAFGRADVATSQPSTRPSHRYKVAACDWMLLKRQKLGAFQLSRDCGMG